MSHDPEYPLFVVMCHALVTTHQYNMKFLYALLFNFSKI